MSQNTIKLQLCPDRVQHLGHASVEAEQPEHCRVSPDSGGQVETVVIIIVWHNFPNGRQVPRPPRPGQTQVPQVGDDIPGGEGALREARVSLSGDPMIL